jgi:4-hydroxybenzoate polyprenyltransferase
LVSPKPIFKMHLLNLIRFKNLLFIIFIQVLIKYVLFESFGVDHSLSGFHFALLLFSTLLIAAGGYIINDLYDLSIDAINKPNKQIINKKISEKNAYNYYITFTASGVVIGFYLSNHIGFPGFAALFILISALLYVYATYIKSIALLGNIVIALLVTTSILIVGLFDLFPSISATNIVLHQVVFSILLTYSFFAFFLTLIREIIKDIEDINGDKNGGLKTLPILIGRKRTAQVALVLGIIAIACILYYMYTSLYRQPIAMLYFLFFVIGPLLYFCIKVFSAEKKEEFGNLSSLLKLIMLFGLLSILLYKFNFV